MAGDAQASARIENAVMPWRVVAICISMLSGRLTVPLQLRAIRLVVPSSTFP
jgi:hypothetical protein